jgi:hypothetical protein
VRRSAALCVSLNTSQRVRARARPTFDRWVFPLSLQVLKDIGQYSAAVSAWRTSLSLAPGDVDTLIAMGLAAWSCALEQLEGPVGVGRGDSGSDGCSGDDAMAAFRGAWLSDPAHPFSYVGAATVHMRSGDVEGARSVLAAIAQPRDVRGHYHDLLSQTPAALHRPSLHGKQGRPGDMAPSVPDVVVHGPLPVAPPFGPRGASQAPPPPPLPPPPRTSALSPRARAARGAGGAARGGGVLYLTSPSLEDVADMRQSLRLLRTNFLARHGAYPVVVFHDGLTPAQQASPGPGGSAASRGGSCAGLRGGRPSARH